MSMNSQEWAKQIEDIMAEIFDCDRFGMGGIVNSYYISEYPIHVMFCGLTYLYGMGLEENEIRAFFEKVSMYAPFSIDDFLRAKNQNVVVKDREYTMDEADGELQLKAIIQEFSELRRNIKERN